MNCSILQFSACATFDWVAILRPSANAWSRVEKMRDHWCDPASNERAKPDAEILLLVDALDVDIHRKVEERVLHVVPRRENHLIGH